MGDKIGEREDPPALSFVSLITEEERQESREQRELTRWLLERVFYR